MTKKIDTHHHLWNLNLCKYAWLTDEIEDSFIGNYEKIRINYLIDNYLNDLQKQNVMKSVHIQAGWDRSDSAGETEWLQSIADKYGYPHGIVAYANFADANIDVERLLIEHCKYQNIRGIRQILSWHENSFYRGCPKNFIENSLWQKNFGLLEKYNLSFDMQIYPSQMPIAFSLAKKYPGIQIILNHAGMPLDLSEEGLTIWRKGLFALATQDNVAIKISGIGMINHNWTIDSINKLIFEVINIFGVGRCMFGSNFPVDKLYSDYDTLFDAYQKIVESFSKIEQEKLFIRMQKNFIEFERLII